MEICVGIFCTVGVVQLKTYIPDKNWPIVVTVAVVPRKFVNMLEATTASAIFNCYQLPSVGLVQNYNNDFVQK